MLLEKRSQTENERFGQDSLNKTGISQTVKPKKRSFKNLSKNSAFSKHEIQKIENLSKQENLKIVSKNLSKSSAQSKCEILSSCRNS